MAQLSPEEARLATYPEVMTAGEVAEVFRVEAATVVKWLNDGHLPGFQVGPKRTWRVWRDEIRTYLEANRNRWPRVRTSGLN